MTAQTTIDFAIANRDAGIHRAVTNADAKCDKWSDRVYGAFKEYLASHHGKFQTEEFREWLGDRVPDPPSKRAFGHIIMRAARAGIIKQVGFAHVKNPKAHRANSAVWMAV